jgi:AcrR family transcriptional regulator
MPEKLNCIAGYDKADRQTRNEDPVAKGRWIDDLEWKSPAKQDRSQRTIDALLDAAERLFAERGCDATSVTDIARDCGMSIGALYHHFKDKAALKQALAVRGLKLLETAGMTATDPARWEGATIPDILRGLLEFALRTERKNPGFKMAVKEAVKADPALFKRLQSVETKVFGRMRDLLMMRRDEVGHPDPEMAIRFVLDMQSGIIHMRIDKTVTFYHMAGVPDDRLVEEVMKAARAYLQLRPDT